MAQLLDTGQEGCVWPTQVTRMTRAGPAARGPLVAYSLMPVTDAGGCWLPTEPSADLPPLVTPGSGLPPLHLAGTRAGVIVQWRW